MRMPRRSAKTRRRGLVTQIIDPPYPSSGNAALVDEAWSTGETRDNASPMH